MKYYCDVCNKKLSIVHMNGYFIGDRLLEDVWFEVDIVNGKPKVLGVNDDSKPYFHQLNEKMWIKRCQEYCDDGDDFATCPTCRNDVPMWGE